MQLLMRPFGEYSTNCYIVKTTQGEIIIDPGKGALEWVLESCENPLVILNTHGHFDHVWSDAALKIDMPSVPLVLPASDLFMLQSDCFDTGLSPCTPDILVDGDEVLEFGGVGVQFRHFPGHTPGCSTIEIGEFMFSGDFVFKSSIGRSDFPYSSPSDMRDSLLRFGAIGYDKVVYPGHGERTTIAREQKNLRFWLSRI
ncbi:MAG: MBL fold metallo-hydrolase [Wolinella sp.]